MGTNVRCDDLRLLEGWFGIDPSQVELQAVPPAQNVTAFQDALDEQAILYPFGVAMKETPSEMVLQEVPGLTACAACCPSALLAGGFKHCVTNIQDG